MKESKKGLRRSLYDLEEEILDAQAKRFTLENPAKIRKLTDAEIKAAEKVAKKPIFGKDWQYVEYSEIDRVLSFDFHDEVGDELIVNEFKIMKRVIDSFGRPQVLIDGEPSDTYILERIDDYVVDMPVISSQKKTIDFGGDFVIHATFWFKKNMQIKVCRIDGFWYQFKEVI